MSGLDGIGARRRRIAGMVVSVAVLGGSTAAVLGAPGGGGAGAAATVDRGAAEQAARAAHADEVLHAAASSTTATTTTSSSTTSILPIPGGSVTSTAVSFTTIVPGRAPTPPPFRIGFAKESVDPSQTEIDSHQLHLGGYGLGPTRASTGPLVDGDGTTEHIDARAMAISDPSGHNTLLLGALENQGTFAAYKQGPYGIWDMRQQVSKDTGVPVDMIVINSDHSHAGPDLIGLWGGVPISYLQRVYTQTVRALDQAYAARKPAFLWVGTSTPTMPDPASGGYIPGTATPGEFLVHSQFSQDTATSYPDDKVDTQLRVLQAVDAGGRPLGTLINYAAHATVMGGGNTRYSADWPGRVATATESMLSEPVALTMVADVGRSQPPRPHSNPDCGKTGQESCDVDQLDTYTRLLTPFVLDAVLHSQPVNGNRIAGDEVFTREPATNAALLGVSITGEVPVRGYGAYRSATPPFFTGNAIGTFVSAHRIGGVLLTANPGEAYPDIRFGVAKELAAPQAFFTFGLANDQLGYLIAPTTEYGWITASNPGNDNSFFNVTPQYGDHIMCTQTAAGAAIGFATTGDPQPYGADAPAPPCPALTATDAVPMGAAPQQPWPFGDGVALPPPFPQ